MKFLILVTLLSLMVSCGKKSTDKIDGKTESSIQEESKYGMPKIGFQKSINLNYRFAHSYELLTFDPSGRKEVLGDMPFYLFLNQDNSLEMNFYSKTDLKSVGYLDLGAKFETTKIRNLSDVSLLPEFKKVGSLHRQLTYGMANFESPEQDMLNKVFIIETEVADLPLIGWAKLMVWVTCDGSFNFKNKNEYRCGDGKLMFHYKLLDYQLKK